MRRGWCLGSKGFRNDQLDVINGLFGKRGSSDRAGAQLYEE